MNNTISIVTRDVNEFLKHPLIIWAEKFLQTDTKLTYEQLINSTCFHAIIRSIDPRLQNSRLPNEAADTSSRLVNLDFTLRSIRSFVQDVLRYIIVARLPNIYLIAHEPYAEYSFDEIERILLLLLACSVSGGDRKEIHIEQLTQLNESTQQSLMPYIEELTNDINTILQPQEYFFNDTFNTDDNQHLKCLFTNIIHLIHERDHYFEEILELEQDKTSLKQKLDLYQSSSSNLINTPNTNLHTTPSQTSLNTFLNELETKNPGIEITDYKTKMRQMKSDLDDQMDTIETMRDEFEALQTELTRLKTENFELNQNARLIRIYRDEIDTLNYKLNQMEKDQHDFERYKERVQQGEIYKKQIEELQNENKLLSQDRSHLENQIEEYRIRINEMFQNEINLMKFKHDIENLTHERDLIQDKLSTILEDKVRLEFDLNSTTHTVDTLNHQLQQVKSQQDSNQSNSLSISLQIQQTIKNRLLQTDLEKKQLNDQLTSLKERYDIDMHKKRIDEDKQIIHIQLLNEQINEYLNHLKTLEIQNDQLIKEKYHLENQYEDQRIQYEKIRSDLETNNKHLKLTLNTLQQREQMETNAKFQDIERENQRLQERIEQMIQQISQLQIEHDHLILVKDRECTLNERIIQLQLKFDQLARENLTYEKRCEIYEKNLQHYQTLQHDYLELKQQNEYYHIQIKQFEKQYIDQQIHIDKLEKDNENFKQQHQQYQQLIQKLNDASNLTRTIEIKLKKKQDESDLLKQTIEQLKHEQIISNDQIEQTIHHSFQQTIDTLNYHIQDLQTEKIRLQNEHQQLTQQYQTLQNEHFKQQQTIEQLENDRTLAMNSSQHYQQTNEQLIYDHDQLQKLYTKLEQEFDTTINQLTEQRTTNRMLTKECKYLQIELDTIVKEKQNLLNRISYLLKQIHQYESKLAEQKPLDEQYNYLQKQYHIRTEDLQETLNINQDLKQQLDQIKLELSKSRSDFANIQMKYTNINAEYANLITKYEFLEQQTERMEEEKSQLIEQLHNLVQQNQNVLAQALSNKDLFHEEARGYLEQLHQLMRQKELLEMKIMEQYKNMPIHKPRRSRGLIQSVSRKTRNILDRLANRRTRTSSADGHLFLADSTECTSSPGLSSFEQNGISTGHARSTTPDVISSSLTSARHYQPTNSELLKNRKETDRHHQSTDSLADSSSKDEEDESSTNKETNTIKSSTPIRIDLQSKAPEFILNNHRQSPFRPIRDSPALQHSTNDLSSNINNQRRCSSTQSFLIHPNQINNNINNTIHSSIRRHRFHSSIISSPYVSQQQSIDQQTTSLKDHVLITEFGAI